MRALAALRAPVDDFFLKVTVNADDPELRLNRLRLLGELRDAVHTVADFPRSRADPPLPLAGEGWGEGKRARRALIRRSAPPSPAGGRRA